MLLDVMLEIPHRLAPERLIILDPPVNHAQRSCVQMTNPCSAGAVRNDQTRRAQHAKMFRDRWPARTEVPCDIAHRTLPPAQQFQDLPPGRVSYRSEHRIVLFPL